MMTSSSTGSRWTTTEFALSPAEWTTSAVAVAVSSSAYLRHGRRYLAPGVVGDLAGFVALSRVLRLCGARPRHEAAFCLACIGAVLAARPRRLASLPEPLLWAVFATGLTTYVTQRRRVCD